MGSMADRALLRVDMTPERHLRRIVRIDASRSASEKTEPDHSGGPDRPEYEQGGGPCKKPLPPSPLRIAEPARITHAAARPRRTGTSRAQPPRARERERTGDKPDHCPTKTHRPYSRLATSSSLQDTRGHRKT